MWEKQTTKRQEVYQKLEAWSEWHFSGRRCVGITVHAFIRTVKKIARITRPVLSSTATRTQVWVCKLQVIVHTFILQPLWTWIALRNKKLSVLCIPIWIPSLGGCCNPMQSSNFYCTLQLSRTSHTGSQELLEVPPCSMPEHANIQCV